MSKPMYLASEGFVSPTPVERLQLIEASQTTIRAIFKPLIAPYAAKPIALINMPCHNNVGDSALALGELVLLRELNISSNQFVANTTVPPNTGRIDENTLHVLRTVVQPQQGLILFAGGGNMGTIYIKNQRVYSSVIREFRNCRIIHLPQSLVVNDTDRTFGSGMVDTYRNHTDLHLLLRDRASYELALRLRLRDPPFIRLCPDMAFMLGDQSWRIMSRATDGRPPFLWMERGDAETVTHLRFNNYSSRVAGPVDWRNVNAFSNGPLAADANTYLRNASMLEQYYRAELARGASLLATGKVLLTDRLHGQIVGCLLGLPVVVLRDKTMKGFHYFETWTHVDKTIRFANDEAALATAEKLLAISLSNSDKLTVVLMSFPHGRINHFPMLLQHYSQLQQVYELILVWNGELSSLPKSLTNDSYPKLRVSVQRSNSLNNRYNPGLRIATRAVLIVDDDVMLRHNDTLALFELWKTAPDQLVGVVKRSYSPQLYRYINEHVYGAFHFVLPHAMIFDRDYMKAYWSHAMDEVREYVDRDSAHCDDIAFNLLVQFLSRKTVLVLEGAKVAKLSGYLSGVSSQTNRQALRVNCTQYLWQRVSIAANELHFGVHF